MLSRMRPLQKWTQAAIFILAAVSITTATTSTRQLNLVDLVGQSQLILHGTVKSVTDGIDSRGIPYTEVTIRVAEALRGDIKGEYTFRQFASSDY